MGFSFLASGYGYGGIMYVIFGIIIAAICAAVPLFAQIIYMVKAKKSAQQKAINRLRLFSKINTFIGGICVAILVGLIIVNGADNRDIWHMLWPILIFGILGFCGLSQAKNTQGKDSPASDTPNEENAD